MKDFVSGLEQAFSNAFPQPQPKTAGIWPGVRPQRTVTELTGNSFTGKPVPPQKWVVNGWIPAGQVTLLAGDGGTGKTLLGLQLCAAMASGKKWLDMPVQQDRAIFVSAEEDCDELHRRLAAIVRNEQLTWENLADLKIVPLAGQDAVLGKADLRTNTVSATELLDDVERITRDWQAGLVVLDALHNIFAGEENSRVQAVQFVGLLRGLCSRCETTVVLLGHPSLYGMSSGSGTAGSTGWSNAVRSRLYMSRLKAGNTDTDIDRDVRTLEVKKANYGPSEFKIDIRWSDGIFRRDAGPASPASDGKQTEHVDNEFLRMLVLFNVEGRKVSSSTSAPNNAAKEFAADPRCAFRGKRGKTALKAAMARLRQQGRIVIREYGPPSRRCSCLVPVQTPLPAPVQTLLPSRPDTSHPAVDTHP